MKVIFKKILSHIEQCSVLIPGFVLGESFLIELGGPYDIVGIIIRQKEGQHPTHCFSALHYLNPIVPKDSIVCMTSWLSKFFLNFVFLIVFISKGTNFQLVTRSTASAGQFQIHLTLGKNLAKPLNITKIPLTQEVIVIIQSYAVRV